MLLNLCNPLKLIIVRIPNFLRTIFYFLLIEVSFASLYFFPCTFLLCSFVCFKCSSFSSLQSTIKDSPLQCRKQYRRIRETLNSKGMLPRANVKYTVQ